MGHPPSYAGCSTLEPMFPISGLPLAVRDGDDRQHFRPIKVNYREEEPLDYESAGSVQILRPALRGFRDSFDCSIKVREKSQASVNVAREVPIVSRLKFRPRLWMESDTA